MFLGIALVLFASGCGGKTINYGRPEPTETATRIQLDFITLNADNHSDYAEDDADYEEALAALLDRIRADLDAHQAIELARTLDSWVDALDRGAASRSDLVNICAGGPAHGRAPVRSLGAANSPTMRQDGAAITNLCAEVRSNPYAHTLREWADLIGPQVAWAGDTDD
jgi:hypothetical protein